MRTTLDIDDDVLTVAKTLATRESKPTGQFVSELLREALRTRTRAPADGQSRDRYGFRPIPAGGSLVTNDIVDEIRDGLGV